MEHICHKQFAANFTKDDLNKIFVNGYNQINIENDKEYIYKLIFQEANRIYFTSNKDFIKFITRIRKRHKIKQMLSKTQLNAYYCYFVTNNIIERNVNIERYMKLKAARSRSGIISVTIFTSGELLGKDGIRTSDNIIKRGGCPMNCHYCPFEKDDQGVPTQPRSYLSTEPGNMRATQNKHHPVAQVYDRLRALDATGHINIFDNNHSSKIELIISGGTFNFYPKEYIKWFSKCAYYAFNTYFQTKMSYLKHSDCKYRDMLSLIEEQVINERSNFRVIGLTIETRPDYVLPISKVNTDIIDFSQIKLFREIGVTRVQIGVQTTRDDILKLINRKCYNSDNIRGLRALKQNGFKTDIHIMLDLPGSSPEIDKKVIKDIVYGEDLLADQWKIYPTEVTPFTKIKEWYEQGKYKPYAEEEDSEKLIDVTIFALSIVPKYVRINRIVRDIPEKSILGGLKYSNLRQVIKNRMDTQGIKCQDIREREVKFNDYDTDDIKLDIMKYNSSSGIEYFISYCSKNGDILYGFIRLRLNKDYSDVLDSLNNKALIRELHVFGEHCTVNKNMKVSQSNHQVSQHQGLGKKLIQIAEIISYIKGYKNIAVISGTGVRQYYRKRGYTLGEYDYMYKNLKFNDIVQNIFKLNFNLYILYFLLIFSIIISRYLNIFNYKIL